MFASRSIFFVLLFSWFSLFCNAGSGYQNNWKNQKFDNNTPYFFDLSMCLHEAMLRNKPALVVLLGKEGCPWSKHLTQLALHSDFIENIKRDVVLGMVCGLDEDSMLKKYDIQQLPSVILIEPLGELLGYLPYPGTSALEFAMCAQRALVKWKRIKTLVKECDQDELKDFGEEKIRELYLEAEGLEGGALHTKILSAGLLIETHPFFSLEKYVFLARQGKIKSKEARLLRHRILELAEDDLEVRLSLALVEFYASSDLQEEKPKSIVNPLVDYIEKFGARDTENIWKVEAIMAQFFFDRGDLSRSQKHAKKALCAVSAEHKEECAARMALLGHSMVN